MKGVFGLLFLVVDMVAGLRGERVARKEICVIRLNVLRMCSSYPLREIVLYLFVNH